MIMILFRQSEGPGGPMPSPYTAEFQDDQYEMAMKEIESLVQHWQEVWAYLQNDEMGDDWVIFFDNTPEGKYL